MMPTLNKMEYQNPKQLAPLKVSSSYRPHQQYQSHSPLMNKI
jgi:hypothetical protein